MHNELMGYLPATPAHLTEGFKHFAKSFSRLCHRLRSMEERKYLPPKFSSVLQGLLERTDTVINNLYGSNPVSGKKASVMSEPRLQALPDPLTVETPHKPAASHAKYRPLYMSCSRTHQQETSEPKFLIHADINIEMEPTKPTMLHKSHLVEHDARYTSSPRCHNANLRLMPRRGTSINNPIIFNRDTNSTRRKRMRTESDIRKGFVMNF